MPQNQPTSRTRVVRGDSGAPHVMCEHQFEVARVDGQCIPDLWICRQCGQRVVRKRDKPEFIGGRAIV